jgi:chemotaxis protein methyltransferase CheR
MPASKQTMLQSRLLRRIRELGLPSIDDYHDRFFNHPEHRAEEIEHLLNLATTNKTDFLREPDHFNDLVQRVLPTWLKQPHQGIFRVWCAGCSTGEEAYTLAMYLEQARKSYDFDYSIRATDVCTRVLEVAQRAIYPIARIVPVPAEWRSKYLLRGRDESGECVRITANLRARVRFGHLNFLAPHYGLPEVYDAVFFRNVMIYFDRETQQQVVAQICRHLRPGGTLFIAHAETLQGLPLPLKLTGASIYRRESDSPL